jgi:hypothetical protein
VSKLVPALAATVGLSPRAICASSQELFRQELPLVWRLYFRRVVADHPVSLIPAIDIAQNSGTFDFL